MRCCRELPCVWLQEATPDGFREVTLEVNGKIIATVVAHADMTHEETGAILDHLKAELKRRC